MTQSPATRYHAGLEAERAVARIYLRSGWEFVAHRFRGQAGEIDLIFRKDALTVFVEVKKSRSHERASIALTDRQVKRILATAEEFAGRLTHGLDSEMRFDVATVDQSGAVNICTNALAA